MRQYFSSCINYVQYKQGCAVRIKNILISISKNVQYKQVNHQVLVWEGGGGGALL